LRFSQADFAEHLGVSVKTVSNWERSRNSPIPLHQQSLDIAVSRLPSERRTLFDEYLTAATHDPLLDQSDINPRLGTRSSHRNKVLIADSSGDPVSREADDLQGGPGWRAEAQREHERRAEGERAPRAAPDPSPAQGVDRLADGDERLASHLPPPVLASSSLAGLVSIDVRPQTDMDEPEDDEILRLFLDLQDRSGGDDLYQPLVRHIDRASRALRHRSSRTRLAGLGALLQMAGWLAIDSNRHGQARQHLSAALYIAHEVDDAALAASALAYMSLQQVYLDMPGKALSLARTATDTAHTRVSPLVATMLGTRLARAHARLGHRREALDALDRARAGLDRSGGDEPVWISYVDEVELSAQAGAVYLDLDMGTDADQALREALRLLDERAPHRGRDRVHYLSRLAKTSLLLGNVDEACIHADLALRSAPILGSARMVDRLGEVADALRPYADHGAAGEVRERVAALGR
jgi:tetratricopeptide (TPR) repeat protein